MRLLQPRSARPAQVRQLAKSHRCSSYGCQRFVLPHHNHLIFNTGSGQSWSSLQDQAAVLFCALSDASIQTTHKLVKNNDKMISGIYQRLDKARKVFVEQEEKNIVFGKVMEWNDVEADELDLGKKDLGGDDDPNAETVMWEQWGGVVERGLPRTLVLVRLNPKLTKRRAPGPGPFKKTDWARAANRYLKNKKVVLHTDGAKSYMLKTTPVDGLIHDWVVHKRN